MKKIKMFSVILFLILSAMPVSAREIIDLAGRSVTVPDRVERIVALGPGALRLVVYLKAADLVVGIETLETRALPSFFRPYSSVISEKIAQLPQIGSGGPGKLPQLEALLASRAQVVFSIGLDRGQVENLQAKTGIPVVILSYGKLGVWRDEALQSLKLMGMVLHRPERAAAIARYLKNARQELSEKTAAAANPSPRVYFGGLAYKGMHGIESTEAGYAPGALVDAENVVGDNPDTGHIFINKEQLLQWNPQMIFLDCSSRRLVSREYLEKMDYYQLLRAVTANRVYSVLPYNQYNTNIASALANAYYIGSQLYPDSFKPGFVAVKIAEIFNFFLGLKVDSATLPAYRPFSLQMVSLADE